MLSNIMQEQKGVPFILIRKKEPTPYPQYPYETEYRIFYDYTDNKYYQSGNEKLKEVYTDKRIQEIFKELTPKANKKIKLPESKIYLKFDKPNQYGVTEWETHKGIGALTEICVEGGEVTDVRLLTYYPDWPDLFRQPQEKEYEFNRITPLIFEEVKELLLEWSKQCDFGFDNFRDDEVINWEEFEKETENMDYTESMIYYANKYLNMSDDPTSTRVKDMDVSDFIVQKPRKE